VSAGALLVPDPVPLTLPAVAAAAAPTVNLVMAVTVGGLYAVGFYLLLQRSLMRVLIGVVVLGHGTNLLLQLAGGPPGRAPIVGNSPPETFADPLPQALALTAVVITFALTTFLLALGYRSFVLVGHDEVQDDLEDRRIARAHRPATALEDGSPDRGDADRDGRDRDADRDGRDRDEGGDG
jgi:multicomponent Na+:H+ antiporter subunit C